MAPISNDWLEPLKPEFRKPYYAKLYKTVMDEYHTRRIYPPADDIFNAFALTPLKDVKVVILGQDPYHGDGQAHGLCFSVKPDVEIPPSLVNIYKELHDDCGCYIPDNGYLTKWAKQGVLLLNTVLTVRAHQQIPTGGLDGKNLPMQQSASWISRIVQWYFCCGADRLRWKKSMLHRNPKHLILEAPHPSPLSAYRGFFGCKHFSQTNEFLKANGLEPIDWQIENRAEQKTEE